jgi:hypothetical protein
VATRWRRRPLMCLGRSKGQLRAFEDSHARCLRAVVAGGSGCPSARQRRGDATAL